MGQTREDIEEYDNALYLITNSETIEVDTLAHMNENGLYTMGVFGAAHDRDASTAILAVAFLYHQNPSDFQVSDGDGGTRVMTLNEALNDPGLQPQISSRQDVFLAETQERSLATSDRERYFRD